MRRTSGAYAPPLSIPLLCSTCSSPFHSTHSFPTVLPFNFSFILKIFLLLRFPVALLLSTLTLDTRALSLQCGYDAGDCGFEHLYSGLVGVDVQQVQDGEYLTRQSALVGLFPDFPFPLFPSLSFHLIRRAADKTILVDQVLVRFFC